MRGSRQCSSGSRTGLGSSAQQLRQYIGPHETPLPPRTASLARSVLPRADRSTMWPPSSSSAFMCLVAADSITGAGALVASWLSQLLSTPAADARRNRASSRLTRGEMPVVRGELTAGPAACVRYPPANAATDAVAEEENGEAPAGAGAASLRTPALGTGSPVSTGSWKAKEKPVSASRSTSRRSTAGLLRSSAGR